MFYRKHIAYLYESHCSGKIRSVGILHWPFKDIVSIALSNMPEATLSLLPLLMLEQITDVVSKNCQRLSAVRFNW